MMRSVTCNDGARNDVGTVAIELPKVSIITVCYNSASTLEKTIQSVCAQTYPNLEYIIIDGGSNDGTIDVINRYNGHIAFWVSEPDEGISDAFNKGIHRATGDIIGIINADDWYEIKAVECAVTALIHNLQVGFVFGDQQYADAEGNYLYTQRGDPDYLDKIAYENPSIPHPTVFFRRNVYEQFGVFDKTYNTAMDYELLLRITVNGVVGLYIPVIMAHMRLGGESDQNDNRGYREVMEASIKFGYNEKKALFRYLYKCCKTFLRKYLESMGFQQVVRVFRTYIGKRYRYE